MARILLVDDDQDILRLAEAILTDVGYDVYTSTDVVMAMEMLNSMPIDLLISDLNMPDFTGFELIKTIRSHKTHSDMMIAMLTSSRERASLDKAVKLRVNEYIVKPIEPESFLEKVSELIDRHNKKTRGLLFVPSQAEKVASCTTAIEVNDISDDTISFNSPVTLQPGTLVKLNSPLFEELSFSPVIVKAQRVRTLKTGFEVIAGFSELNDAQLQELKNWLTQKQSQKKSA